jgi:hypothetical protein
MNTRNICEIKKNQESLKRTLEGKIDKLRIDLIENIDKKVKSLRDELTLDINKETVRIDNLLTTVHALQARMLNIEQSHETNDQPNTRHTSNCNDPEVTVIASGLAYNQDENLLQKAQMLIEALGEEVYNATYITDVQRLSTRNPNRPGIVKISFRSLDEKILVLRNKLRLRNHEMYSNVLLKSSKSYAEQLIERNTRAIIRELPHGRNLRINANGKIIQRTSGNDSQTPNANN